MWQIDEIETPLDAIQPRLYPVLGVGYQLALLRGLSRET
jgi:hypothetical protein